MFEDGTVTVLLVSLNQLLRVGFKEAMPHNHGFIVETTAAGFEAGIQLETLHPACIIVDFAIGEEDALEFCRHVHKTGIPLVVLVLNDGPQELHTMNATIIRHPFNITAIAQCVKTLTNKKETSATQ